MRWDSKARKNFAAILQTDTPAVIKRIAGNRGGK
jgi:hypothetical protein